MQAVEVGVAVRLIDGDIDDWHTIAVRLHFRLRGKDLSIMRS